MTHRRHSHYTFVVLSTDIIYNYIITDISVKVFLASKVVVKD